MLKACKSSQELKLSNEICNGSVDKAALSLSSDKILVKHKQKSLRECPCIYNYNYTYEDNGTCFHDHNRNDIYKRWRVNEKQQASITSPALVKFLARKSNLSESTCLPEIGEGAKPIKKQHLCKAKRLANLQKSKGTVLWEESNRQASNRLVSTKLVQSLSNTGLPVSTAVRPSVTFKLADKRLSEEDARNLKTSMLVTGLFKAPAPAPSDLYNYDNAEELFRVQNDKSKKKPAISQQKRQELNVKVQNLYEKSTVNKKKVIKKLSVTLKNDAVLDKSLTTAAKDNSKDKTTPLIKEKRESSLKEKDKPATKIKEKPSSKDNLTSADTLETLNKKKKEKETAVKEEDRPSASKLSHTFEMKMPKSSLLNSNSPKKTHRQRKRSTLGRESGGIKFFEPGKHPHKISKEAATAIRSRRQTGFFRAPTLLSNLIDIDDDEGSNHHLPAIMPVDSLVTTHNRFQESKQLKPLDIKLESILKGVGKRNIFLDQAKTLRFKDVVPLEKPINEGFHAKRKAADRVEFKPSQQQSRTNRYFSAWEALSYKNAFLNNMCKIKPLS